MFNCTHETKYDKVQSPASKIVIFSEIKKCLSTKYEMKRKMSKVVRTSSFLFQRASELRSAQRVYTRLSYLSLTNRAHKKKSKSQKHTTSRKKWHLHFAFAKDGFWEIPRKPAAHKQTRAHGGKWRAPQLPIVQWPTFLAVFKLRSLFLLLADTSEIGKHLYI